MSHRRIDNAALYGWERFVLGAAHRRARVAAATAQLAALARPATVEPTERALFRVLAEKNGASATRPRSRRAKRRAGTTRRVLLSLLVIGVVAAAAGVGTYSAFTATTSNTGNSYAAGTVVLSDNDAGGVLTSLSNAKPGSSDTGCIKVTYTGSLAATVRLYGSPSGSLGPYLTLTVTRGTDAAPSFRSCTAFVPDATDYIGSGPGVLYSGNLSAFPTTYAAGLVDPTASWTNGTAKSYRFVVTLQDNDAAQGLSATAGFTWEARNT